MPSLSNFPSSLTVDPKDIVCIGQMRLTAFHCLWIL
jgi:hypothetical protein